MVEDLPNMVKDINLHIQEAHQIPNKITSNTTQVIFFKFLKTKDKQKCWKQPEKISTSHIEETAIRMNTNFSTEKTEARRQWRKIFKEF